MLRELTARGPRVQAQVPFPVIYKGASVGTYVADIVVNERLLLELKCADRFSNDHIAQCLNYLRASGLQLALIVIFRSPESSGSASS